MILSLVTLLLATTSTTGVLTSLIGGAAIVPFIGDAAISGLTVSQAIRNPQNSQQINDDRDENFMSPMESNRTQ